MYQPEYHNSSRNCGKKPGGRTNNIAEPASSEKEAYAKTRRKTEYEIPGKSRKKQKGQTQPKGDLLLRILLSLLAALFCLPVVYVVISSLSYKDTFGLGQYLELMQNYPSYFRALRNSLFYAAMITAGGMILSVPTAYLFARVRFRGRNPLFFVYIITMMLPAQSTILGQYLLLQSFGWIDTRRAIYLPLMLSPLTVFLLRQNLKLVSSELIDAVRMETNSFFFLMFRIILPQLKNTLAVASILLFCESWNIVEQAMILLPRKDEIRPLSVMMNRYPEELRSACATIYLAPVGVVLIVFAVLWVTQKIRNRHHSEHIYMPL